MLLETVDVHRFIMGDDWPVKELLKRGFAQDTQSEYHYQRQLPACGLTVDMHSYAAVEDAKSPNSVMVDVYFDDKNKTWVLWSAVIPFKLVGPALDKILPVLEVLPAAYFNGPDENAHQKEIYDKLETFTHRSAYMEALDPKEYIMSNAWVTDDLRKMGFEALNPNDDKYFVKRFYAKRSKTWGALMVWIERSNAHVSIERLQPDKKAYREIWSAYVTLPMVSQMVPVLTKAFSVFQAFHEISDREQMSMMVADIGRKTLGAEYTKVYPRNTDSNIIRNVTHVEPPVEEAMDPKQFIAQESPMFEFKTKMDELGWHFLKVIPTPTVYGNTLDVHKFEKIIEPSYSDDSHGPYTMEAYASEFTEDDRSKLSCYGGGNGTFYAYTSEGERGPTTEEKDWSTEEFIQPDTMSPADFAEWVDDEICTSRPK